MYYMEKPLISICIPTYNRSSYLVNCLDSIIEQSGFEKIQIVISDNCSTDDTRAIAEKYRERFDNIKYYRNDHNVGDENFALAISRGDGLLRKLTNDTIVYRPGALNYMIDLVEKCATEKPQLYFLSSGKQREESIEIDKLEDYVRLLGYRLTWIASIAIWEQDCNDLNIMTDNSKSNLGQIPFLLYNFEKHSRAIICDKPIMTTQSQGRKDVSYGLYKVFYKNFMGHIKPYCDSNRISKECYEEVRKRLLLEFFCIWVVNLEEDKERYIISDEDLRGLLKQEYNNEYYYDEFIRAVKIKKMKVRLKRVLNKLNRLVRSGNSNEEHTAS